MPRILKRPRAEADITEIWEFIAEDSEARADAFIDQLDRKLRTLAKRPNMGRGRGGLAEGLRSFPLGRYVIFYLPLPDGIDIVRVLHGARDVDSLFNTED